MLTCYIIGNQMRLVVMNEEDIIILVFSSRENVLRRDMIRRTWAKPYNNVYFVVGNKECPIPKEHRKAWACEEKSKVSEKSAARHKSNTLLMQVQLEREAARSGDLIMVPMVDYYRALPRKLKQAYRWALNNTKAKWIVKVDDDAGARISKLNALLAKKDHTKLIVLGYIRRNNGVPRDGKWAELNYQQNISYNKRRYPPFANGAQDYVVSRGVAEAVVEHNGFEYQGEDVSLGIWLNEIKKDVEWVHLPEYFGASGNCYDKSKIVIGHDISPSKMWACFKPDANMVVIKQVNPLLMQIGKRFDIVVKTVYAMYAINTRPVPRFVESMYYRHLKVWNNFKEPCTFHGDKEWFDAKTKCVKKSSADDFKRSFISLINSIRVKGFDKHVSLVPLTKSGFPLNGAHRIAVAISLGLNSMPVQSVSQNETYNWGTSFFRENGMEMKYIDFAIMEWTLRVPTTTVIVWPQAIAMKEKMRHTKNMISDSIGEIIYEKTITVSKNGLTSLVFNAYGQQVWLEAKVSDLIGKISGELAVKVLFVVTPNVEDYTAVKTQIRAHYGIQKSSVHISDNHNEAILIAESVLNPNSVDFLNFHKDTSCSIVARELAKRLSLRSVMQSLYSLPQDIMVDSGAVMAFFGLRPRTDVDIIFENAVNHTILGKRNGLSVEPHTFKNTDRGTVLWNWGERDWGQEHFGGECKDVADLFHDPSNYGYCNGLKFVSLKQLVQYKKRRGELRKDDKDVRLIEHLLSKISDWGLAVTAK